MKRLFLCLLASICMIAAACSGSSTESTATTEAPVVTEAPVTTETTAETSFETEEHGSLEEEFAKAMPVGDEEFLAGAVDSEETALCIATEVVSSVGENRLTELGITPASLNDDDSVFPDDESLINGIVGAVEKCGDLESINENLIFGLSMLMSVEPAGTECLDSLLDDGLRVEILKGQISGITETQEWSDRFFTTLFTGCSELLTSIAAEIFGESSAACIVENMEAEDLVMILGAGEEETPEQDTYFASLIPWDACPDILISMLAPFFDDDYALTNCIIDTIGEERVLEGFLSGFEDSESDTLFSEAWMSCQFGGGEEEAGPWTPIEAEGAWSSDGQQGFIDGCVFVVGVIPELSLYNPIDFCGCILTEMMKDVDEMEYYINMDQDGRDAAAEPYLAECMV